MAKDLDALDIDVVLETSGAQRTPCVLALDTSSSMSTGGRIDKLNEALQAFETSLKSDETLCQQVLLMVISFGGDVKVLCDWTQADTFIAPTLEAEGLTPMGGAMRQALLSIEELREKLKENGIAFTRPWIFLMSDGGPNDDDWINVAAACKQACEQKQVVVWPLAVPPGADGAALKAFARDDMKVYSIGADANFTGIFEWLKTSLGALVNSGPGQQLQIKAPSHVIIDV